ncbi:MAG: helix-turn-helix transcriptional regulator [Methylobacter sp.]|nr:helix-turn-helix transcriptional regulator [Methylobacter sp.]
MSDLKKYVAKRKESDEEFALNFNEGYQTFKIGVMLKEAREAAGITQEEPATRLCIKKSSISRMENQAEDVKLPALEKIVSFLARSSVYECINP